MSDQLVMCIVELLYSNVISLSKLSLIQLFGGWIPTHQSELIMCFTNSRLTSLATSEDAPNKWDHDNCQKSCCHVPGMKRALLPLILIKH